MFRLSNEDYFIEPLEGVPVRPGHAQPHVVYKRQAPERGAELGGSRAPGTCGVPGMVLSCPGKGMGLEAPSFFAEASLDISMHTSPRTKGTQTDTSPQPVPSKCASGLRPLPARHAPADALG